MCGIVGYIGPRDALEVVISGLEKLEYRGYDSAGVALLENGKIEVSRAVGKLSELKRLLAQQTDRPSSPLGIGHTRWATHGRPSEANAHPHTAGRVSLIHNGIIENYLELREGLSKKGVTFLSETDTEIAAHLLDGFLKSGKKPIEALQATCQQIRGSYAFLAIDESTPGTILVAKTATPIIIGIGEKESFVASDIPAVLPYTKRILVLEDGDIAEVKATSIKIINDGKEVKRAEHIVTWDPVTAQKGGFKHFMLKEIHEQVTSLTDTFRGRIDVAHGGVVLPEIALTDAEISRIERIVLVACGTAWHACLVAKYYIESLVRIPCEVDYASEFRYREPVLDGKTLVIAISQSGETADTLAAIELASEKALTLSICNVLGSTLARKVKSTVFTHAGPEISVASTKAFTTQLIVAYLVALYLGEKRGTLSPEKARELFDGLRKVPSGISEILRHSAMLEITAKKFHAASDFIFLGRGICYPIALEGALKLKEISYIHAEGYPAGEIKHGPLALIDEKMPVVVVLHRSQVLYEKVLSNLREVEARGGRIICVTDATVEKDLRAMCDTFIEIPWVSEHMSPILLTIPLQLLAYHVAVLNGTDVDLPRNLAKSVTVE